MGIVGFIFYIVSLVGCWTVYKKMGREGWEGIIPIYNIYALFEEVYGNGWKCLWLLVPIYDLYVIWKISTEVAVRFHRKPEFGWGLFLLNPIFVCILAFDKDVYQDGSKANTKEDFVTRATATVKKSFNEMNQPTSAETKAEEPAAESAPAEEPQA